MKVLLCLILVISGLGSIRLSAETTADIGSLRLTLPAGYRHERLQGTDSLVGVIHITEPSLNIEYDVGGMAGSPGGLVKMEKSDLAAVVYFEELSIDGVPAYFLGVRVGGSATERRLFLNFPGADAFFFVNVASPKAMLEAKAAFLRIKFLQQPPK